MSFVLLLFISMSSFAGLLGPENYYVVQQDNMYVGAKFEDEVYEALTLRKGQVVHLDGLYNGHIAVDRNENGKTIRGDIAIARADIEKMFGPKQNPANGNDQSLTVARRPVELQETKIVDQGRGGFELMQRVCADSVCRWVKNESISRGGRSPVTGLAQYGTPAPTRSAPCPPKTSVAKLQSFNSELADALKRLPSDERDARSKIEDAIGPCVTKSPKALNAYNGHAANHHSTPGTNLYDAAARGAAESAFKKVSSSASRVHVRLPDGSARAVTKEDFVTIDAFARTLFGEMRSASCQSKEYIPAVARTILNRSADLSSWGLDAGPLAKTPVLKVLLANRQYSVWNNVDEVGSNVQHHLDNVHASWCPTKNNVEQEVWQKCVDTAMHAYLDRTAFLAETAALGTHASYTSDGRSRWSGHKMVADPTVYGGKLSNDKCMQFWDP